MPARRQEWEHGTVFGYDKRACRCDACCRARRDYDQERYARLKDLRKQQNVEWRDANREKVRGYSRAQYERDPEKARECKAKTEAKLLARDPEYRRRIELRYSQSPKGRLRNAQQQARRRGVVIDEHADDFISILVNDPCAYCGGPAGTVDHIAPVSKGGTSECVNLTAACGTCNSSKRDTDLLSFLLKRAS